MNFDEAVVGFKEVENKEAALLVLEDVNLRKLLAAWPMVHVTRHREAGGGWEELWQAVEFSDDSVSELAGISLGLCKQTVKRAIGLRLIYPDGSIHSLAKMALQKRIKDALQG